MRFFAGIFNGNIAVARAYIDVSTPKQFATRMGLIGAAFGLGFTIGPFIGGEFQALLNVGTSLLEQSLRLPYLLPCLIASILSAGSLVLAYFKLPESIDLDARERNTSWGRQMSMIASNSVSMLRTATIGAMIWVSMLLMLRFTVMHLCSSCTRKWILRTAGLDFRSKTTGVCSP